MKIIKILLLTTISLAVLLALLHKQIISGVLLPQYIDWAHQIEAEGLKNGEPLSAEHLALAAEIGIESPEKVRVIYTDLVPYPYENLALKLLGEAIGVIGEGIVNNAQVFGYSIYVRHGYELDRPKMAHELVHVLQIERSNLTDVITQHIYDMAEYGYENAPLEAEAFEANKRYSN